LMLVSVPKPDPVTRVRLLSAIIAWSFLYL
jgi:hypothetical protein